MMDEDKKVQSHETTPVLISMQAYISYDLCLGISSDANLGAHAFIKHADQLDAIGSAVYRDPRVSPSRQATC
jgi:hypothetical protein